MFFIESRKYDVCERNTLMDNSNVGQLIASERKKCGLTQKELADKLAISDKTVSKWETGRGLPDVEMLISMCRIFDISLNELITGERFGENEVQAKAEESVKIVLEDNSKLKKSLKTVFLGSAFLIACFLFLLLSLIGTNISRLGDFFDIFSIVSVLGILIAIRLIGIRRADINKVFDKCILPVGLAVSLVNLIMAIKYSADGKLGSNVAVCLLPLLYAAIIYIIAVLIKRKE
jgi:transcriptional regulator with XRE-family HTH domain